MIFNLEAGEVKTLPITSEKYPEDVTVKVGENAVFSAVIEKDGVPTEYTYQWYVNDSLVSGETNAVYTRKTDSDNGVYNVYCEITNKAGVAKTRTATLVVNALPKLDSAKPANGKCEVGKSITLEVAISEHGYPKEYTYQWYKNGSKISGANSSKYAFAPSGVGATTLYCEVTNSAGTVKSRTATITPRLYLYKSGNQCTSVSGGWSDAGYSFEESGDASGGSVESTHLLAVHGSSDDGAYNGCIGTQKTIKLTDAKTLFVDGVTTQAYASSSVYVTTRKSLLISAAAAKKYLPETRSTINIDVSKVTGSHYICFGASRSAKATSKVYNMWLE